MVVAVLMILWLAPLVAEVEVSEREFGKPSALGLVSTVVAAIGLDIAGGGGSGTSLECSALMAGQSRHTLLGVKSCV